MYNVHKFFPYFILFSSTDGVDSKNLDLKGLKKEKKMKKQKLMSGTVPMIKNKPLKEMPSPPPSPTEKHSVTGNTAKIGSIMTETKSELPISVSTV